MLNIISKEFVDALKYRVFDQFQGLKPEEWPLPNKKTADEFIERLVCVMRQRDGKTEYEINDEIFSLFDEYPRTHNVRYEDLEKNFGDYPKIFFWQVSLRVDEYNRHGHKSVSELYKYITEVTESILLQEDGASLVEEIKKYAGDKAKNRDEICYSYFFAGDGADKFYSRSLYEKVKQIIPGLSDFDKSVNFVEDSEESDAEDKEVLSELPDNNLCQEISDDEIVDGEQPEDILNKIRLLMSIGDKKAFFEIWEIIGNIKCDSGFYLYAETINNWSEHLPLKLLKKEVEKKNNACILGALNSENEYAVRALLAYICDGDGYINEHRFSLDGKSPIIRHYRRLIILFGEKEPRIVRSCSLDVFEGYSKEEKYLLKDILGIVSTDSDFGRTIKKKLESAGIDINYKPTYEQFCELRRLVELSADYEQELKKVPFALRDDYLNYPSIVKIKYWLYENKEPNIGDADFQKYDIRFILLEKPFFFPEYSSENEKFMDFYSDGAESRFSYFMRQEKYEYYKTAESWRIYWRQLLEKAYNGFEQPTFENFENPRLPIIPEYADYILSRANDIFSTAIENLIYKEYRAFLTESRKKQIRVCLKSKIARNGKEEGLITEEEAAKLVKLAEDPEKNYYAWSDKEVKECLSPDTDPVKLGRVNAILEPEFMVRVFEKSILWVINHKDSELWQTAPWFGTQIFNRSYSDRPSIWAKHLLKIAEEWGGSKEILKRLCTALGHLREPLGSKVPAALKRIAEDRQNDSIKESLVIQHSLFGHENFRKMHHGGNEVKRVDLCRKELIIGQNREVKSRS